MEQTPDWLVAHRARAQLPSGQRRLAAALALLMREPAPCGYPPPGVPPAEARARLEKVAPSLIRAASEALEVLLSSVIPAGGCDDEAAIVSAATSLRAAIQAATTPTEDSAS